VRRADRLAVLTADLGGALAITADVTDRGDIRRIAETTLRRHGQINALVNNAGASLHLPLDRLDPEEFARALDLNVVSVLAMTQAVLPVMRAQGSGSVVNVSPGTARLAPPGSAAMPPARPPSTC
jgi:NADP-dependent 3-hydroxy acid dehydrogenase YdfG